MSETVHKTEVYPSHRWPISSTNWPISTAPFVRIALLLATGLDGLRVVQVTLAMIASARDGRTVKIEPLTVRIPLSAGRLLRGTGGGVSGGGTGTATTL